MLVPQSTSSSVSALDIMAWKRSTDKVAQLVSYGAHLEHKDIFSVFKVSHTMLLLMLNFGGLARTPWRPLLTRRPPLHTRPLHVPHPFAQAAHQVTLTRAPQRLPMAPALCSSNSRPPAHHLAHMRGWNRAHPAQAMIFKKAERRWPAAASSDQEPAQLYAP